MQWCKPACICQTLMSTLVSISYGKVAITDPTNNGNLPGLTCLMDLQNAHSYWFPSFAVKTEVKKQSQETPNLTFSKFYACQILLQKMNYQCKRWESNSSMCSRPRTDSDKGMFACQHKSESEKRVICQWCSQQTCQLLSKMDLLPLAFPWIHPSLSVCKSNEAHSKVMPSVLPPIPLLQVLTLTGSIHCGKELRIVQETYFSSGKEWDIISFLNIVN